jgi:hypothetical protein
MKRDRVGALQMLNRLIDAGFEYADAEFKVAIALNMNGNQVNRLRDLYDHQGDE